MKHQQEKNFRLPKNFSKTIYKSRPASLALHHDEALDNNLMQH